MSTSNTEFLQVWGQVKGWPVELRQNLADEISRSVESDLVAAKGPWSEAKNARRCELIDKEIQGNLSDSERAELALLQREMRIHRDRISPLPIAEATQLHQHLLARKREQEQAQNGNL